MSTKSFRRVLATGLLLTLPACAKVYGPFGDSGLGPTSHGTAATEAGASSPAKDDEEEASAAPEAAKTNEAAASPASAVISPAAPTDSPRAHPYQGEMPSKLDATKPAVSVADLSPSECEKEVTRREIPLERDKKAWSGVTTPMRLTGKLHGVRFVTPPASSKFGVMDCRLGLALDDLASALSSFSVVEVHVDNIYRPNAHLPGKKKSSQHAFGLAVDITKMELADGRELQPGDDWNASIGDVPCGPNAVMSTPNLGSIALRDMVCEVAREGLFHDVLTPSFNAAHKTHFHFDIKHDETHQAVR